MRVNREKNVLQSFKKTAVKTYKGVKYGILDQLDEFSVLLQILTPFLFYQNVKIPIWGVFLLSVAITYFTRFLTAFYRDMADMDSEGLPVPPKRFTSQNKAGFVVTQEEDGVEITRYLYSVEEYLEKKGLLRNEEASML